LVPHLNNTMKPVCYPFEEYNDVRPGPAPGVSMRFGVILADQYEELGRMCRRVFVAVVAHPGTIPIDRVIRVTNTRRDW
jgi:hypothetical protein